MLGRKVITGIVIAATLAGGVMVVGAQQGEPLIHLANGSAINAALEAAAEETGLDSADIMAQLVGGTTLADIVAAEGGDVQTVIDAAVAAMTEQVNDAVENGLLTQTRADLLLANLEESVTEAVNGEWSPGSMRGLGGFFGERFGRNGQGPMHDGGDWGRGGRFEGGPLDFLGEYGPFVGGMLEDLGIDRETLTNALQSGSTVAEAITAAGGDPEEALAAALAAVEERLATAVDNGRLTQDEADALQAQAELRLAEALNASPLETRLTLQLIPNALELASDETGLTRAELRQQLAGGTTLADILTEHEVDLTAFVDTLVERAEARINVQVVDGNLTQAQADALLAEMRDLIEERINSTSGESVLTNSSI